MEAHISKKTALRRFYLNKKGSAPVSGEYEKMAFFFEFLTLSA